jgi:hypothetical protein
MKNFDTDRKSREIPAEERAFTLGGESFIARSTVRPEALTKWDAIAEDMSVTDILTATDETILALIEDTDNGHERYRALRQREEDPLGVNDLVEVGKWLVEVQTGRPIEPPSDSTDSPPSPGTNSTEESSSPETPKEPVAST